MISNPYEWRVFRQYSHKTIFAKVDPTTLDMIFMEEWYEDPMLEQARHQREKPRLVGPDLRPLAVIPKSVEAKAMKEGWYHDEDEWIKWANDSDNRNLRTSDGTA